MRVLCGCFGHKYIVVWRGGSVPVCNMLVTKERCNSNDVKTVHLPLSGKARRCDPSAVCPRCHGVSARAPPGQTPSCIATQTTRRAALRTISPRAHVWRHMWHWETVSLPSRQCSNAGRFPPSCSQIYRSVALKCTSGQVNIIVIRHSSSTTYLAI